MKTLSHPANPLGSNSQHEQPRSYRKISKKVVTGSANSLANTVRERIEDYAITCVVAASTLAVAVTLESTASMALVENCTVTSICLSVHHLARECVKGLTSVSSPTFSLPLKTSRLIPCPRLPMQHRPTLRCFSVLL